MDHEIRGFAFEGAAMGLALLDGLTPWRGHGARIHEFLQSTSGDAHIYMIHVGPGWVWARMPLDFRPAQGVLDPLLRWLAFDGWGFHEGFFHWQKYVAGRTRPKSLKGYERRVFDQGLGRSLWFVNGGNPELIERTILGFNKERHSDMWSGIGLAATYAGFASAEELRELPRRAGKHQAAISQGAVFAAKARDRAGNSTAYTEMAAQILCGMSASEAAHLSDVTLEDLDSDDATSYESWRLRIQERFATESKLEEVLA